LIIIPAFAVFTGVSGAGSCCSLRVVTGAADGSLDGKYRLHEELASGQLSECGYDSCVYIKDGEKYCFKECTSCNTNSDCAAGPYVLLVGHGNGKYKSMESWSPYDANPPQYKYLNNKIEKHSKAAFFNGKIYSCGGQVEYSFMGACYTMTPGQVNEEWTKSLTAKFKEGRALYSLTVVGNKLVAAGGEVYSMSGTDSVEIMTAGKETFEKPKWKLKEQITSHCAVATSSDELVITGGKRWMPGGVAIGLNKVTKYNITDGATTDLPNLPIPAVRNHACALFENKITISGGYEKYGSPYNKEVWQLDEGTWSKLPSMPEGREGHAMMVVDGKLYVFGGLTGKNVPVKNIIELDLEKKAWIEVKKLAENFAYGGSVLIEN